MENSGRTSSTQIAAKRMAQKNQRISDRKETGMTVGPA